MRQILAPSEFSATPDFPALPPTFGFSPFQDGDFSSTDTPESEHHRRSRGGFDLGLVSYETSPTKNTQTHQRREIKVNPKATRLKKMRSTLVTAGRLFVESQPVGFRKERVVLVTFTYRPGEDYKFGQLTHTIDCMVQWFKRRGHEMRYGWSMEMHKSGIPHYHLVVWLPKGLMLPKPDKQGWWKHGMTNITLAKHPIAYIAKYLSKGETHGNKFPPGARIYGTGGLSGNALLEARWWKLPAWAREHCQPSDKLRRRVGGGILNPETGEILATPWRVLFRGGEVYIFRVDDTGGVQHVQ